MSNTGRRSSEVIVIRNVEDFDRQEDYQYIAKSISDGKYHVGYVAIDKPWYSPKSMWTYYLIQNEYSSGGFCGGSSDLGFKKIAIDKDSIKSYTIKNRVWLNDIRDMDTIFVNSNYLSSDSEKDILGTDIDEVIKKLS
jgi:hypothetical protein